MAQSSIEWTELTWNPVTGCTKVSQGCKFCYAEVMTRRLKAMGVEKYKDGFNKVRTHPDTLKEPYSWNKSRVVFVNSMSDLFHPDVPVNFIKDVFRVMSENPQHVFQVLTKRTELLLEYDRQGFLNWTDNIWMGTSVEDERVIKRISTLQKTGAKTKFLSCEPLIGPLPVMNLEGIDWVIVGGESGHAPRPMKPEWVINIKQQCEQAGVSFFFKQWGGRNKKKTGRELNGKIWSQMPEMPSDFAM
ncbi:MAG: phage Gp37/Gp68 family protein [Candidatus Paceibacterota bacterium]